MNRDLFNWADPVPSYPRSPGFKEKTTSRDAARKIAPRAQTLRDQVYATLRNVWPAGLTADEVALRIGRKEFSVRPRLSELRATKEIMATTIRRPNESGVDAIVWVCRRPLHGGA